MKSHFTVIGGLRDLYLNRDVLLKITSYRDSYVIGAIDTSVNRCFEYHGPMGYIRVNNFAWKSEFEFSTWQKMGILVEIFLS